MVLHSSPYLTGCNLHHTQSGGGHIILGLCKVSEVLRGIKSSHAERPNLEAALYLLMKHGNGNILARFLQGEKWHLIACIKEKLKWVLNFMIMTQYNKLLLGRA